MVRNPVRSIIGAVAGAAARWSDAGFPARVRARDAVSQRTRYTLPVVDYAFDRLFSSLQRNEIEAVIADELGSLDILDRFVHRPGRPAAHALPLGRVCIISSRTTIGAAIIPAVFALCAKCEILVKDREDHFVTAFFASVAEELNELRDMIAVQIWNGERNLYNLAGFDGVVAFGSDVTLTRIAAQLHAPTRFIPYGSKASAGFITRKALEEPALAQAIARDAARDVVLYDTEGCLSLHVLFVESGACVSAASFGEMLAEAIAGTAGEFPPGPADPRLLARLAAERDLATFRAPLPGRVYADAHSTYLVLVDPPAEEPPLFLPRALAIRSVANASEAASYIARHGITLEALAVNQRRQDLTDLAAQTGAARIAAFGALQAPPLGGFHGGRPRVAEFVRWIVDET